MTIREWLEENVTKDERALAWLAEGEAEDRIVRAYRELLSGYSIDAATVLKTTCEVDGDYRGAVRVQDISFSSLCAHHFLPFFGTIEILYVPGPRILGLGKFPRLVSCFARRFQIQEHLVRDIALEVMSSGEARAVRVDSNARHLCMCARGPASQNASTETSYLAGETHLLGQLSPESHS
ncbi:GTP cyclohydrolase I [Streptomyces mirabilis]|uniref:GTP cyclohydrolase I n=1 Tax=Streptomyces mirabilis TaxID=68239 RepID=UPI00379A5E7E